MTSILNATIMGFAVMLVAAANGASNPTSQEKPAVGGHSLAAADSAAAVGGAISTSASVTATSLYVSGGKDLNDGTAAIQWSFEASLPCALYAGVWSALSIQERPTWEQYDEYDFYVGWVAVLHQGRRLVKCSIEHTYLLFPYFDGPNMDYHQSSVGFELPPSTTPGVSVTPYSKVHFAFASNPQQADAINTTTAILGLSGEFVPGRLETTVTPYVEVGYNSGGARGVRAGVSHLEGGVRTEWALGSVRFQPGIHFQFSLEKTVDEENEVWTTLRLML